MKYGRLTVIQKDPADSRRVFTRCDCGNVKSVRLDHLRKGLTKSCGCLRRRSKTYAELLGSRFGRLTILSVRPVRGTDRWRYRCECQCDCGKVTDVGLNDLKYGITKSCGCYAREVASICNSTHGFTKGERAKREYEIWNGMLTRCYNTKAKAYQSHGAKGVTVCDRWRFGEEGKSAFECFYEDMGDRPSMKHSLDRILNGNGYEKANCRWATASEQARNRSTNRVVFAWGRHMTLAEAVEIAGISDTAFYRRIKNGMSETEAIEGRRYRPRNAA